MRLPRAGWDLVLLALLSPFFFFPPLGRIWIAAILLLPIAWLLAARERGEPLAVTPFNGPLALLMIMVGVSVIVTPDLDFSAPKVLGVVFGVAVFHGVAGFLGCWVAEVGVPATEQPSNRATQVSFDLFALSGGLLAALGLIGTNWMAKMPLLCGLTANLPAILRGVPGQSEGFQPNAVAGALVMFLPLQFVIARRRPFFVALFVFSLIVLLLCQSRNATLSLGIAVLFAILLRFPRRVWIAVLALAIAIAVFSVGPGLRSDVTSRFELWSRAMAAIADFPFTGMGMNSFRRVMPVLYPSGAIAPDLDVAHAHNHLLQAAVDLGLPGLVAYLAIWFVAARLLIRNASDRRILGLGIGMLAYFLFGMADAIALGAKVGIFFWIALALIAASDRMAWQPK